MEPPFIVANVLALVWLGLTWWKAGFLHALNLFLYGSLTATAAVLLTRSGLSA